MTRPLAALAQEVGPKIAISALGPTCPNCGEWRFDDWWHDATIHAPGGPIVSLQGRLRCHGCGRFFAVTRYADGVTHSTSGFRARAAQAEGE